MPLSTDIIAGYFFGVQKKYFPTCIALDASSKFHEAPPSFAASLTLQAESRAGFPPPRCPLFTRTPLLGVRHSDPALGDSLDGPSPTINDVLEEAAQLDGVAASLGGRNSTSFARAASGVDAPARGGWWMAFGDTYTGARHVLHQPGCLEQRQGDTMDAIRGAELHPWPQEAADGERKRGNKVDDAHGATDNKGRRRGLSPDAGDGERCRWTSEGTAGLVGVSGGRGEGPRALGGGPPSHGRCVVELCASCAFVLFSEQKISHYMSHLSSRLPHVKPESYSSDVSSR
jgi:hypothetical protein